MSLARTAAILTGKGEVPEQDPAIKLLDRASTSTGRGYSSGTARSTACASQCSCGIPAPLNRLVTSPKNKDLKSLLRNGRW
jgi:hypothetical protein